MTTRPETQGPHCAAASISSIQIVDSERGFARLESVWDALVAESAMDSPFLTFDWQWSWWKAFSNPATDRLHVVLLSDSASGEPRAILPWLIRRRNGVRVLQLLGSGRSDYLGAIYRIQDDAAAHLLVQESLRESTGWDVLDANNVFQERLRDALREVAEARGFLHRERLYERAPYITIRGTFGDFVRGRSKNFRRYVRRHALRGSEPAAPYALERLDLNAGNARETVGLLAGIERRSWKYDAGTGHLQKRADLTFWADLLPRLGRRDRGVVLLLRRESEPVAFVIGLVFGRRLLTHTSAYAADVPGAGVVVRNALIEMAFDKGFSEFDFLCGDEPYKFTWTDQARDVYQVVLARPHLRGRAWFNLVGARWRLSRSAWLHRERARLRRVLHRFHRSRLL